MKTNKNQTVMPLTENGNLGGAAGLVGKTTEFVVLTTHARKMLHIYLEIRDWSSGRRSGWQH